MNQIACPACKSTLESVRPKRIAVIVDDVRWKGEIPEAIGFACPNCEALLPLTAAPHDDDAG